MMYLKILVYYGYLAHKILVHLTISGILGPITVNDLKTYRIYLLRTKPINVMHNFLAILFQITKLIQVSAFLTCQNSPNSPRLHIFCSLLELPPPCTVTTKSYGYSRREFSQAPVAHTCNPSYSGGRVRRWQFEARPRQIVCKTLSGKNPSQKKGWYSGSSGRMPV
jgi:hypothetical protein